MVKKLRDEIDDMKESIKEKIKDMVNQQMA
jgi:hypothetical protein